MIRRVLSRSLLALFLLLAIVQLYPYGRAHENPPTTGEPAWNSPSTRELTRRACGDCHSNETRWPWYSHVAPASWLIQHDVDEGREHFNFSEFDRPQRDAHEASEELEEGNMPLQKYLWLHPTARLDDREREQLIRGLSRTFGEEAHVSRRD